MSASFDSNQQPPAPPSGVTKNSNRKQSLIDLNKRAQSEIGTYP